MNERECEQGVHKAMNVGFSSVGWWHKISRDTETTIASKKSVLRSAAKTGGFKRYIGSFLENNKSMSAYERERIQNIISKFDELNIADDGVEDDNAGLGLCFGDAILLEFLQTEPAPASKGDSNEWGFLTADITRSGHVGMAGGNIRKPPRDIGDCLWTIEPVYQHCAYRELRAYMSEARSEAGQHGRSARHSKSSRANLLESVVSHRTANSANSLHEAAERKRLERALVQEIRFNDKLALRRKGDPIAFGQPVMALILSRDGTDFVS